MLLTYAHPAYIWIYLTRKLKKRKLAESSESSEPLRKKETGDMDQSESTKETENCKSHENGEEESPRQTTDDCAAELCSEENKCTHL